MPSVGLAGWLSNVSPLPAGILAGGNVAELSLIEPLRLGCGPIREREQSRDGEEIPRIGFLQELGRRKRPFPSSSSKTELFRP